MDKVAVVILNYNGRDFLQKFLPNLIQHSSPGTVYVADNKSTDDSLEILKQFPEVRKIELAENNGYAGGYNLALSQIEAEYYALVNSDIEVTKEWLSPLINYLDTNRNYAAVQPKLLDYKNKNYFEYAGAAGGYLDGFGYPFCRGRLFEFVEEDNGQYQNIEDIFWCTGACFVIRSHIFNQIGGFDASFFAHMEEIDLCWRINSIKLKIAYIPNSTVYHVGGGTLNKINPNKTYLNFRNGIWLLLKNLPKHHLIYILPIRILLDWVAAFLLLKNQSFSHFTAVFKAHFYCINNFRAYIKQTKRSNITPTQFKSLILPLEVFLKGKRTFNEL